MGKIVTVNFRGDELYGFENDDGVFVALKPIVEAMGLNWSGQLQRLKRDPILSEGVCVMHTPFGQSGSQEASCLKLELVNGWLFTIDSRRIKDETVRERVLLYQRECCRVLAEHFLGKSERLLDNDDDAHEPEGTKVRLVTETRQTFGTRAAGQLWMKLGLPVVPAMLDATAQGDIFDYSKIKTIEAQPAKADAA